jgi:hypothetical protein
MILYFAVHVLHLGRSRIQQGSLIKLLEDLRYDP